MDRLEALDLGSSMLFLRFHVYISSIDIFLIYPSYLLLQVYLHVDS